MLKIFAAFVLVIATKRHGSKSPDSTPFSQITDIRSSNPLTPLGILLKSSLPNDFCSELNVVLLLPVVCILSLQFYFKTRYKCIQKKIVQL